MNPRAIGNFALAGLFASAAIVCVHHGIQAMRDVWPDAVHYTPSENGAEPSPNVKVVDKETEAAG